MSDQNELPHDSGVYADDQIGDRGIPSVAAQGGNRLLIGGIFCILLLGACAFVIADASNATAPEKPITEPDDEQFSYSRNAVSEPLLKSVPAPAQADTTPRQERRSRDGENQRLAMLQAEAIKRQEAARQREIERMKSPQLAYSAGQSGAPAATLSARQIPGSSGLLSTSSPNSPLSGNAQASRDPDATFFEQVTARGFEVSQASEFSNISSIIPQGTLIPGVLEPAISSDVRGQVRAITSHDVWAMDQSHILIPRGSRLIGEYNSDIRQGQARLYVIWTRLIRSDGVSVSIGSGGTDDLGRAGLSGDLDTHFWDRFGSAIILTIVDGAIEAVAEAASDSTDNTIQLGDGGSGIDRAIEETIRQNVNIRPTIRVDQGERINVFLARDLDFSSVRQ